MTDKINLNLKDEAWDKLAEKLIESMNESEPEEFWQNFCSNILQHTGILIKGFMGNPENEEETHSAMNKLPPKAYLSLKFIAAAGLLAKQHELRKMDSDVFIEAFGVTLAESLKKGMKNPNG